VTSNAGHPKFKTVMRSFGYNSFSNWWPKNGG